MSTPTPPAPSASSGNRIDRFLRLMNDRGASDLHLSVGRPPIFRLSGRMEPIRYPSSRAQQIHFRNWSHTAGLSRRSR